MCSWGCCQVTNVCTLQYHLHTTYHLSQHTCYSAPHALHMQVSLISHHVRPSPTTITMCAAAQVDCVSLCSWRSRQAHQKDDKVHGMIHATSSFSGSSEARCVSGDRAGQHKAQQQHWCGGNLVDQCSVLIFDCVPIHSTAWTCGQL